MRKQFLMPILVGLIALSATEAFAQTATVVMRNGERLRADVVDMGRAFSFTVNGQPRSVPIGDVVMLDFAGDGRNVSVEEVAKVNGANGGYVVMRSGEQFNATLQDFTGKPLIAVFSNGRKNNLSDVARIYMGSVANVSGFPNPNANANANANANPNVEPPRGRGRGWGWGRGGDPYAERSNAPASARSVVVPSNVEWTSTGIMVSQGQWLRFEPSGEIRLSTNGEDIARASGATSGRHADRATIPSVPVGALIARINNGAPFSIGDSNQAFQMSATGRLFLGVNDDHVPDNSGNFVVKIWEP